MTAVATVVVAIVGVVSAVSVASPASAGTRFRYRPGPTSTTTAPPTPAPAAGSVLFGAATETVAELSTFNTDVGKPASLYLSYYSFALSPDFDATTAGAVAKMGATNMVTWEPWDPSNGSATQPAYSLANIAGGSFDSYISRWAAEIKAWGQPVWLRFAHEMNGNWYPWAASVNGNSPAQYVAAFRHVHDLFLRGGVTNVTWVWTPNVDAPGFTPISQLYPGDQYVDWVGVDGYNWGTTQTWGSTWQTPSAVFATTLSELRRLTAKPIVVGETASAEQGGSKAQWIQQFFSMLGSNPDIKAFVWFNINKETAWPVESSSTAQAAFAAGIANNRYQAG